MELELHLEMQNLSMAMTVLKKQENSHGNKMPQVDLIGIFQVLYMGGINYLIRVLIALQN